MSPAASHTGRRASGITCASCFSEAGFPHTESACESCLIAVDHTEVPAYLRAPAGRPGHRCQNRTHP
ncbi:unnamed protein product [Arctogadus glacialis]